MSYLTPSSGFIDLGVDLGPLACLRGMRSIGRGPDRIALARLSEAAGADAILIGMPDPDSAEARAELAQLRSALMIEVHLVLPFTDAAIEFAGTGVASSVRFIGAANDGWSGAPVLDIVTEFAAFRRVNQRLQDDDIKLVASIAPTVEQVNAAAEAGIKCVELRTANFSAAVDSDQTSAALAALRAAADAATRLRMQVQAGCGLDYDNLSAVARIETISQLNVGHAIATRALFCGWARAVSEVKARLVQARSTARVTR